MTTRDIFGMIPAAAKILAAAVFAAIAGYSSWFFRGQEIAVLGAAMGVTAGAIMAVFILLAGYVYADASRRGMPAVPWTALALLIPNGVGFVLYFLLRKPMVYPCSNCGGGVAQDAAFCPKCGQSQLHAGARA
jgi:hypothetical protein